MAPYDALYGRRGISQLCWETLGEVSLVGQDWIKVASKKVQEIRKNYCLLEVNKIATQMLEGET